MKRVFITGGNGFFGSRFREAHHHNFEIFSKGSRELNILEKEKIQDAMDQFRPDYVIHGAAITQTDYCNSKPERCREINVAGALNVASSCKQVGAKLVFLSSEQVFNGNVESGPYRETDIPEPDTVYGKNKYEAEKLIEAELEECWILRFTWLFGVPERNKPMAANIFWDTVKIALRGQKTNVPCNEYRGLTYIGEVLDQFQGIFDLPYGTYHLGSHNTLSKYDVSCLILKEMGLAGRVDELIGKDMDTYAGKPRDLRLNTEKIRRYGFQFSDTPDAVRKCIEEYNLVLT